MGWAVYHAREWGATARLNVRFRKPVPLDRAAPHRGVDHAQTAARLIELRAEVRDGARHAARGGRRRVHAARCRAWRTRCRTWRARTGRDGRAGGRAVSAYVDAGLARRSTSTIPACGSSKPASSKDDVRRARTFRARVWVDHFADLLRNGDESSGARAHAGAVRGADVTPRHRAGDDRRLVRRPAQLVRHPRLLDDGLLPAPRRVSTCWRAGANAGSPKAGR